jgi:TonB family protein
LLYITVLEPMRAVNPNSPQVISFRPKAVSELETTTDANLVGLAGEMLTAGQVILASGKTVEEEAALRARQKARNELASKYLKRAIALDPENSRWRVALERASGEPQVARLPEAAPGVKRITVGGNVQRARLKNEVRPEYPPLAKQARIQGSVRFSLIIATDGTVKNITLLSGHPLLVQPATEAVKQWVFNTTLLNGEPVEVVTEAEVNFQPLEPLAQPVLEGNAYRIGGDVTAPIPISRKEPEFPKGVDPQVTNAVVLLSIVIGKDGSVTNVEPLRGDPAFFENAIEAVKQWKFTPGIKDGEPVPVKANVEVNFRKL